MFAGYQGGGRQMHSRMLLFFRVDSTIVKTHKNNNNKGKVQAEA